MSTSGKLPRFHWRYSLCLGDGVSGLGGVSGDHVVVQLLLDRDGLGKARPTQGGEMEIKRAIFVFANVPERVPHEMGVALRF